ncbi:MAG: UDP-N-acetylmuramoyl-L-alanine--D-glutamate ligase [Rickettsiales bacterium]|jgi:UDP-N-acetylmuramoylalanine--D-glutamate ligase|nr:UDP-N-acetylmuramoyl-L-alanine--D-glutamate ligase [Rickettsiales bacterium]
MKINDLLGKKVLLWGYGLEGKSAAGLLLRQGIEKEMIVASATPIDEKVRGLRFIGEQQILEQDFDVLLKSPGVSSYRGEIEILENRGILVTSILNILLAEIAGRKHPKTLGITGTKGKSTTASICHSMLGHLGFRTRLLGNIGVSFLDVLDSLDDQDYLVLELSSCQLKNIRYRLDYGVLLNLFPEHLDWHINHENYFRDKLNILKYSDKCFINYNDPITSSYVDKHKHKYFFGSEDSFHLEDGFLCFVKDRLLDINSLANLRGGHLFTNICALLAIFREERLDVVRALENLKDFKALPHRLEIFYEDRRLGIKFVDDSIATIPEASLAALETFGSDKIFLILGGFDRQQDYSKIIDFLQKAENVRKVFLIGQTGKRIGNALKNSEYFESLPDLVKALKSHSLENTTVLLSPGAASFDMFKNFEERGNVFRELILSK